MITDEVILKSIDDAIIKCSRNTISSNSNSWGVRFNKAVRNALDRFRRATCTMGKQLSFEKLEIFDNKGNGVYTNSNYKEDSVTYNKRLMEMYRESIGHELHMTHNHPNGFYRIPTCLSWADAQVLMKTTEREGDYLFKSITAETSNGSRMTLIKNSKFNSDNHENFGKAYEHLNDTYHNYLDDFLDKKLEIMSDTESMAKGFVKKYPNSANMSNRDNLMEDYINERVVKEIGSFEDRLGDVRREFNECNVELGVEWSVKGAVV